MHARDPQWTPHGIQEDAASHMGLSPPVDNFDALIDRPHDERDGLYEQVASFSLSSDYGGIEGHAASILQALTKQVS